jgi:disulfide bond formation protein DsbB
MQWEVSEDLDWQELQVLGMAFAVALVLVSWILALVILWLRPGQKNVL